MNKQQDFGNSILIIYSVLSVFLFFIGLCLLGIESLFHILTLCQYELSIVFYIAGIFFINGIMCIFFVNRIGNKIIGNC